MEYSAGMVSQLFAFQEMRKTAEMMNSGMSKEEIRQQVIEENIYQLRTEKRKKETFGYVYRRLSALPKEVIEMLPRMDMDTAKAVVLISIMKTDLLFFEFMHEVFKEKVILGEKTIENRDINIFFDDKAMQSDVVSRWSESGIKKLKQCYMKNLAEAGVIDSTNDRNLRQVILNYKVEEVLRNNDMGTYVNIVKGVR